MQRPDLLMVGGGEDGAFCCVVRSGLPALAATLPDNVR